MEKLSFLEYCGSETLILNDWLAKFLGLEEMNNNCRKMTQWEQQEEVASYIMFA